MPSLTSIFSNNNNQKKCCCTCGCHTPAPINTAIAQEQSQNSSNIILSPTRWFPRIRRRSSSSSSSASSVESLTSYFSSNTYGNKDEETLSNVTRLSAELDAVDHEIKQLNEFQDMYKLAVDEIAYATESQGSIYYNGDLLTATEAVNACLDKFRNILLSMKDTHRSFRFQQDWTDTLFALRTKLDGLPPGESA
ncbi:hypothetical protein BDF20DRAFT_838526 [Mycotypha africana]|uniref:uncharacterized protein n=1 Tax=Mycotypha africana TaxID=64632 RepID=UPI002300F88E|nr:uncharacterized protein BDF20DRAFT_838526 [Mycotypha africana]KAI8970138.1 hypothetical protein BDF20DRAFT_838526 [Mycotypha africana]